MATFVKHFPPSVDAPSVNALSHSVGRLPSTRVSQGPQSVVAGSGYCTTLIKGIRTVECVDIVIVEMVALIFEVHRERTAGYSSMHQCA